MPRVSAVAVAAREALAREMFRAGRTVEQVQAAMVEFDVGGGRKGLKMNPVRLKEIEKEVAGGRGNSNTTDIVPVLSGAGDGADIDRGKRRTAPAPAPSPALVPVSPRDRAKASPPTCLAPFDFHKTKSEVTLGPSLKEGVDKHRAIETFYPQAVVPTPGEDDAPKPPGVRAERCQHGNRYASKVTNGEIVGTYKGVDGDLCVFAMDDGRVFKLWRDEKVSEV